jgi:hypothetical protein
MASRDTLGMDEEQKRDRARSVRSNARMGAHQLKLPLSIGKAPPRVRDGFEGERLSSPAAEQKPSYGRPVHRYHERYHVRHGSGPSLSRDPARRAGSELVGATGFEPATVRPQRSGFRCLCVPERPPRPICPRPWTIRTNRTMHRVPKRYQEDRCVEAGSRFSLTHERDIRSAVAIATPSFGVPSKYPGDDASRGVLCVPMVQCR